MVRFDKPCSQINGAVEYFREHMRVGDYLSEAGGAELIWRGSGALRLGLSGQCRLKDFKRLCQGKHPMTGESLLVRDKGSRRRVCFFGQISPPKDVSLLHLVGGDERIGGWWREAVDETLDEMEAATATRIRQGRRCEDRFTRSMVAAVVTHDASRALDPQLHTHVCIMNVTYDSEEARWKSVQPSAYFRRQGYFREVCYNRLAARMLEAGYELELTRGIGFRVKGVPEQLRDRFSKRRRMITAEAERQGLAGQDALQAVTAMTRAEKRNVSTEKLVALWQTEAGEDLAQLRSLVAAASTSVKPEPVSVDSALDSAEAQVFERRSVVDEHVLFREALSVARGRTSIKAIQAALEERVQQGRMVRSGQELGSQEGLAAEEEFCAWARTAAGSGPMGRVPSLVGLDKDQAEAVTGILTCRNKVVVLQGDAGTGKTTCLQAVLAGLQEVDAKAYCCAPTTGATEELRGLAGEAGTLQLLLTSSALQAEIKGRVIVVDEAGLISVREMQALCRLAATNENRLLLVGDIKQHASVEAGDALRCLQSYARVSVFRLSQIRRQRDPNYRRAVGLLAQGEALRALHQFSRLGAVHEIPTPSALFKAAAKDFVQTVQAGKSCLAISPVWSEIHTFTTAVRRELRGAGLLQGEDQIVPTILPLKWTREERRRIENYQPGDLLVFHRDSDVFRKHEVVTVQRIDTVGLQVRTPANESFVLDVRKTSGFEIGLGKAIPVAPGERLLLRANLKEAGLRNGDLVGLRGFASDGGLLLQDGRKIPPWFRMFTHGYASTSHAAQGKTVDRGILFMADAGIRAGNLRQAYVSNSRFRESQVIYTTNLQEAGDAMAIPGERKLVLELIAQARAGIHVQPGGDVKLQHPVMLRAAGR